MTAKEYLSQAKKLRIKIEQKERLLKELQEKALCNGSQDVKSDRVQTSVDTGSRLEEMVVEYTDLEKEIRADIGRYLVRRNEIIDTIHELDDSRHIVVLHAKWIDEELLEQIAIDMGYSFGHVRNLYCSAMRNIEKIINKNG